MKERNGDPITKTETPKTSTIRDEWLAFVIENADGPATSATCSIHPAPTNGVGSTAYQDRARADAQKFVERILWCDQGMLAIASNENKIALRFRSTITDCCSDRPLRLEELGINSVLAQVSTGDGNGFTHGPLIALLGREDYQ